ncbi:DNA primase [Limnohabitans sp. JirII-29]|uniref:DNA primase n=1 Tax=unclassified Limnohabitans TaxID=2626134 RepID=UPI000C1F0B1E|nr:MULTISPECIES: DNA primase [unclassified Limnohabitans]PIT77328.1 DNA primase [Limnohabitans sp. JirII-31]PUE28491.1 DNA primase [Limnohabitans sp. JirII-29]
MAIPQSFIQELLARVDVVEVVGRYVQLKKGGANFMGLCPFHGEKSPSFSVSPAKQFFHCFGCGKNGNAIGFLMEHAGMNFVEAVKDLAQGVGLQVPEEDISPQDRERAAQQREKQATLTDVLEKAGEAYRKHLKSSPKAVEYLKGRGLSGEIAKQFGLGYAPEGWRSLASVFPDYQDPLLAESGLVIVNQEDGQDEKRYDRFRDRVMFPIRNVKGECIGFGGRVLGEGTPKYLNSPETPVFSKGRELYGLFEARHALRDAGYVLVTEGYMDVVALAQLGFPNAVATLGTACTADHVQKLFRFTDAVVFSFDGDSAGRRAARKALDGALPYASDVRSVKFLFLPAEHDPDSYIREFGKEGFAHCVTEAMPLSRFLIEVAREGCDLHTAEGRAHMASNAKPLWMALPEGALKRQLLGEIASLADLGTHELQELWLPTPVAAPAARSGSFQKSKDYRPRERAPQSWRRSNTRQIPAGRADHAARVLLSDMSIWEDLSSEDHNLLCDLAPPHGPLFAWLDHQHHEHGSQPWGALREGLRGHESEDLAVRVMATAFTPVLDEDGNLPKDAPTPEALAHEAQMELRGMLNRMLIESLKAQETEAIAAAKDDPTALQRYRSLQMRRRQLESAQLASQET